jgi:hypothetical protein
MLGLTLPLPEKGTTERDKGCALRPVLHFDCNHSAGYIPVFFAAD